MKTESRNPAPFTQEAAEALAAELVAEMIERWQRGDRVLPEALLARRPELWNQPQAAADLIYEELCLRQDHGAEVPVEQVLARFPQWRPQLEVLFDCQRLLGPLRTAPQFPRAGELLGDFLLLTELGRGGLGRVFLASQLSLGERPVVLKLTPCEAREHLSLARLQHTHIVPLYSVQDHPDRGLRALCMPYFGGTTLEKLLEALADRPPAERTGQDLLEALDRSAQAIPRSPGRTPAPARRLLARATYAEAVCWLGACLADALHYAHERGLVHLDLKPSNVLLAADGQPMLLDFHLAREPIRPDHELPQSLGGTAGYMSPEQQAALAAVQRGRPVTGPVDRRSDIYSLGLVLYEALGGEAPEPPSTSITRFGGRPVLPAPGPSAGKRPSLRFRNPQVSVGLADLIDKCLADEPRDRYPDMAAVAIDLRRHLAHRPLAGTRNRSLAERWRKWRRRRPHGAALAGMLLAVLAATAAVALGIVSQYRHRLDEARVALDEGRAQLAEGNWQAAIGSLERGRSVAHNLPFQSDLTDSIDRELRQAERAHTAADQAAAARKLHGLADRVRFLFGAEQAPPGDLRGFEAACRELWENRRRIVSHLSPEGVVRLDPTVREDLLDLALFWADLQVRLAPPAGKEGARRQARTVLEQAQTLLGPSPVLDTALAENRSEDPAGMPGTRTARTAWEHTALGRLLLRFGNLDRAAEELEAAVRLKPQALWPNFYQGLCAYRRGRFAEAVTAYSVCIGAAPEAAGCFYNRALAYESLGQAERARRDYDLALRLDPGLPAAALNRGMLHYRAGRYTAALADLQRAQELGVDMAIVSFDLALVDLARGDHAAALSHLRRALGHDGHLPDAATLERLLQDRSRRAPSHPPVESAPALSRKSR
jgi:serine/threonine protein kinase/Flp pilus assembly protein TadD